MLLRSAARAGGLCGWA